jgi:tetratricopeptide (TPR) repeat protein
MARLLLCAALGAAALFVVVPLVASPDTDPRAAEEKVKTALAVQAALRKGLDHLQHGNYQAAVEILETEVHRCGDEKAYLPALESAYRGYIRELQQANRDAEAAKYVERLGIIDPGSRLERKTPNLSNLASGSPGGASTAKQADKSGYEVRGAIDHKAATVTEGGPLTEKTQPSPLDVRTVIARADQAFREKQYQIACKLYQQAEAIDAKAVTDSRECWGYCKMFCVVEALNDPHLPSSSTTALAQEVRQAMEMAPRLKSYGETLLRSLQERGPMDKPAVADARGKELDDVQMRHVGKLDQWSVLETANFRILHNQSRETAERAARIVEQTRQTVSKKWFGDKGEAWEQRCDVFLYASVDEYSRATQRPFESPGHSFVERDKSTGRVVTRSIHMHMDNPNVFAGVLPHETAHAVIAGRYGEENMPRWADEGMAVLAEPRERIDMHLRNLPKHRDDRILFNVGELMELNNYPRPQLFGPFYAQSVSLVDYLSSLKGPQTFTAFLRDGVRGGYEAALKKHFGIQGYGDLERRWQAYAFGQ